MNLLIATAILLSPTQLPRWQAPYKVMDVPADALPYAQLLGDKKEQIVLQGDKLTFLYKSKEEKVDLMTGLQLELKRIPNSDIWFAQAQMENWDKAFFNYFFAEGGYKPGTRAAFTSWAGANAPKAPLPIEKIAGTLKDIKIKSKALNEERGITVYLPPGNHKNLPAVYIADGQAVTYYGRILEPLILAKKVRPVALIGVHCGDYKGDRSKVYDMNLDFRAKEYLKQADKETYAKHLEFFCHEAVDWATKEYGLSTKVEDRAVQGVSNGGAFATTAPVDRPGVFGFAMPFSVAAYDQDEYKKDIKGKKLPKFYFAAGTLETFIRGTNAADSMLKAEGCSTTNDTYVSGHDMVMWNIAFLKYMQIIFPAR